MKRFLSDASWNFGATFIDKFCNLLIQAFLVRQLGIDSYGVYSATCALGQLATTSLVWRGGEISIQALEKTSATNVEERREALAFLVAYDIRFLGAGGIILAPVLWLSAPFFNVAPIVWLLGGLCLTNIGHAAIRGLQTIENRFFHIAIHSILSTVIMTAILIFFAAKWGMTGAIYGLLLGNLAKTLSGIAIERYFAGAPWPSAKEICHELFHPTHAGRSLGSSTSSFLRGILQQILANGDTVAISVVATPAIVGLYKVARAGASVPGALIAPIISVFRGRIVAAWGKVDIPRLTQLMHQTVFFSVFGAAAAAFCAPIAATIIAPQNASRELLIASALMGTGLVLFQGLNTIHLIYVILSRDNKISIRIQLAMVLILLSFVTLTANHGIMRLAMAAACAYLTGAIIFVYYGYRNIEKLKGNIDL